MNSSSDHLEISIDDLIEKYGVMYKVNPRFEDPRGPFTGYAVDYHDNGQLKFKVKFKNGKEDGLQENYYEKGQLAERTNYKNGELHGFFESYYKTGQLRLKGNYRDGYGDGLWGRDNNSI